MKVARTVLNGESGGNAADLHNKLKLNYTTMGTLGCINDMLRRDKENRELRKVGRERLNETRNRLIDLNKKGQSSHISIEQLEEIIIKTQEKEEADSNKLFKMKLIILGIILLLGGLIWLGFALFY